MAQIFISYSRSDRPFLDGFVPLIRRVHGNDSVWFDDDIYGGANWWQMILREVGECDLFIYLISNESLDSPYCQSEMKEALRLHKQILPVIVRRLKPAYPGNTPNSLAAVLRQTQYVDLSDGFKDATELAKLYAATHQLLKQAPLQSPQLQSLQPTVQPPVPDKRKSWWANLTEGQGLVIAAVITVVGGAMFAVLTNMPNNNSRTSNPTSIPTTTFVRVATSTPESAIPALSPTDIATTRTHTADFQQTFEAPYVTETTAPTAMILPSSTSGPTPTTSPLQLAFTPAIHNTDWDYIVEYFDGVAMALVPRGCFRMGFDPQGIEWSGSEWVPLHLGIERVCFDQPFWIDQYEVTNSQYGSAGTFLDPTMPRDSVTWFEAADHCEKRRARLPTEAEWEFAARGPDNYVYPWGNEFDPSRLIYNDGITSGPLTVGSMPDGASWVGALDMAGNAWEWVDTAYQVYPYDTTSEAIDTTEPHVLRGGAWSFYANHARSTTRLQYPPTFNYESIGFRCVIEINTLDQTSVVDTREVKIYRSGDSIAICALSRGNFTSVGIEFGNNEHYQLGEVFPSSAVTNAGDCWCLQQRNPVFPTPSQCTEANTSEQSDFGDWRNALITLAYEDGRITSCEPQPEELGVYECN